MHASPHRTCGAGGSANLRVSLNWYPYSQQSTVQTLPRVTMTEVCAWARKHLWIQGTGELTASARSPRFGPHMAIRDRACVCKPQGDLENPKSELHPAIL